MKKIINITLLFCLFYELSGQIPADRRSNTCLLMFTTSGISNISTDNRDCFLIHPTNNQMQVAYNILEKPI